MMVQKWSSILHNRTRGKQLAYHYVCVALFVVYDRGTGVKLAAIAIEVYSNGGKRVTRRRTGNLVATNPEGYIFR